MKSEKENIQQRHEDDIGIDIGQIFRFLVESWKKLTLGAAAGVAIGLLWAAFFSNYRGELILDNSNSSRIQLNSVRGHNNPAVTFTSWRILSTKLPLLAPFYFQSELAAPQHAKIMHLLSARWWSKNVTPVYSLSKADAKNLAPISQSIQESESTAISHIKISASDVDQETVESNLKVIANFIRTGSAYLELQNLLGDYDAYEQVRGADLRKEVTAAEIELDFLKQQARDLEKMRLRFPSSTSSASNQIMDLKDSGAKYLPIQTQLVAIHTDINNANERLVRLRDEQIRLEIFSSFLAQARAAAAEQTDGLS